MEYNGFKLDLIGLAALVGSITGLVMAIKGRNQRRKNEGKDH